MSVGTGARRSTLSPDSATVIGTLGSMLSPDSVAVIGASNDIQKMGGAALRNLLHFRYRGEVYPINPGRATVQGLPSYRSVAECPRVPDTAIVAVPADAVVGALADLGAAGVRTATVVAAGFSEGAAGDNGEDRTRGLMDVIDRYGLTILGPNTTGLANLLTGYVPRAVMNSPDDATAGPLAVVAQSGALSNTLMCRAQQGGVGVGLCVATGDELGVRVDHVLARLADEPGIGGVLLALESARDGAALAAALIRLSRAGKPIIVLPVGRTPHGRQMAMTHTGALTGDAALLLATLEATGALVAAGIDQCWQAWRLILARQLNGAGRPDRIGVVSFSGGEAAILADRYSEARLPLAPPSESFAGRIGQLFSFARASNPFDLTGEGLNRPALVAGAIEAALADYDLVHFAFPVFRDEIAVGFLPEISRIGRTHPGRLLVTAWPCRGLNDRFIDLLRTDPDLQFLPDSGQVPEVLAIAVRASPPPSPAPGGAPAIVVDPPPTGGEQALSFHQLRGLVTEIGIRTPRIWGAADFVAAHPDVLPVPGVYVKGYRLGTIHKAREGLVHGPLRDAGSVAAAVAAVRAQPGVEHVEVEQELRGLELILGIWHDEAFGSGMTVGLGGSLTEALGQTVTFSPWHEEARLRAIFWTSRIGHLVQQHCGRPSGELESVLDPVVRLHSHADRLVRRFSVMEINPLVVDAGGEDVYALDAVAVPR
jgi:acetate---CoA ligase (ADP-forming)